MENKNYNATLFIYAARQTSHVRVQEAWNDPMMADSQESTQPLPSSQFVSTQLEIAEKQKDVYDPYQDVSLRREIRAKYRQLIAETEGALK